MIIQSVLKKVYNFLEKEKAALKILEKLISENFSYSFGSEMDKQMFVSLFEIDLFTSSNMTSIKEIRGYLKGIADDDEKSEDLSDDGDEMPVITIYRVTREDDGVVLYCIRSSGSSAIDVTEPTFDDAYKKAVELSRTLHGTLADCIHDMSELVEEDPIFVNGSKEPHVIIFEEDEEFSVYMSNGTNKTDCFTLEAAQEVAEKMVKDSGIPRRIVREGDYADNDRPGPTPSKKKPVVTIYCNFEKGNHLYQIHLSSDSSLGIPEDTFDGAYQKAVKLARTSHGVLADRIHDTGELEDADLSDKNDEVSVDDADLPTDIMIVYVDPGIIRLEAQSEKGCDWLNDPDNITNMVEYATRAGDLSYAYDESSLPESPK